MVNVTPFEPEWEGYATPSLANTAPVPVWLYAHVGIAQVIFLQADGVCRMSYQDKKGKYQPQHEITPFGQLQPMVPDRRSRFSGASVAGLTGPNQAHLDCLVLSRIPSFTPIKWLNSRSFKRQEDVCASRKLLSVFGVWPEFFFR